MKAATFVAVLPFDSGVTVRKFNPKKKQLTVVVDGVSCVVDRRLKWFVPVPYIGPSDYSIEVRVTMALRVLDARGRMLLVRTYDSGPQVVASELRAPPNAVWRMAHETVWRLWQQADGDLRHAWQVDRTRDRDL